MLPKRNIIDNKSKEDNELNNTTDNNQPPLQTNGDDDFLFVDFNPNYITSKKKRNRPTPLKIPQSDPDKMSQAFISNLSKIPQVFKSNKYKTPPLLVPNLPKQEEPPLTGSSFGTVETPERTTPIVVFTSLTITEITLSPKKIFQKLLDPYTISSSPKEDLPKTPENVLNSEVNRASSITSETTTNFRAEVETRTSVEPLSDQDYAPLSSSTHSGDMPEPTSLSNPLSSPRVNSLSISSSASQILYSRGLERSFQSLSNENESGKDSVPNQSDKKNSPNTPPRNWRACCWSLFSCFNPSREEIQKKYDDYQPSPTNRTFMV